MSASCYFSQLCINSSAYSSFDSLYTHINFVHSNDPSFKIRSKLSPLCGSIYETLLSYKSHIYKHHRELISKTLDKHIFSRSNNDSNNSFTFSYADDNAFEHETTDNNENFHSTNEYNDEMEVDYPLFSRTIFGRDKDLFDMKKFRKYYTSFLLELCEQHLLSRNIITSITSNFSLLLDIVLKMIVTSHFLINIYRSCTHFCN